MAASGEKPMAIDTSARRDETRSPGQFRPPDVVKTESTCQPAPSTKTGRRVPETRGGGTRNG